MSKGELLGALIIIWVAGLGCGFIVGGLLWR